MRAKTVFQARVWKEVNRGLLVDIGYGVRAFLPESKIDVRYVPHVSAYLGKTIPVHIIEVDPLALEVVVSRRQVLEEERRARAAAQRGEPALPPNLRRELQKLDGDAKAVRSISVFEHPDVLEEALENARRRLLVISPWVRSTVVDKKFLEKLAQACATGVRVHIAYGIRKNDVEGNDPEAIEALAQLADRHPNLVVRDLGRTHAKVLLWDDRVVLTSFNWLSFKGDRRRKYRQEEGTLVCDPEYVTKEYERYVAEIEAS